MRKHFYSFIALFLGLSIVSCSEGTDGSISDKKEFERIHLNIKNTTGIEWNEKQPCIVYYQKGNVTVPILGQAKFRGGISSKYHKHSLSLELDSAFEVTGVALDDDWILNASYIDKTFQRHKLCYDLFRQMSPKNIASKSQYIDLSINGDYQGLYLLMEEINGSMIGLDKNDPEAMLFKDPAIFIEHRVEKTQDSTNIYQQKFPKINIEDRSEVIEDLKRFMFESSDDVFASNIGDYFDLENVLDWHLILLLSNNDDGMFKNFYLYKLDAQTPFRFAIWDYDHSFGRDGDYELNMMERELGWEKIVLLRRLMEVKDYSKKLKRRYKTLRDHNIFSKENLHQKIDSNTLLLEPYIEKNFERWPLKSEWYTDSNNYDQEIKIMKEFIDLRLDYLDKFFNNY